MSLASAQQQRKTPGTKGPVFIIGGSRTGSEMLKTMLAASKELDFVDEPFLVCPAWLHKDLKTNIESHIGRLDAPDSLNRLLDLLFSGIPYGWFWTVSNERLDRKLLEEELNGCELNLKSIFQAIMTVHARYNEKNGTGAKFPVHYSEVRLLLEWFPNCRIIHTTRDPRAVYASQSVKYISKDQGLVSRSYEKIKQFVHINIQTTWTARIHQECSDLPNYVLIRYEDVVHSASIEIQKICDFLEVDFKATMLAPNQYGSSYNRIGSGQGVDPSSLQRWRRTISPLTARVIALIHQRAFRVLGYSKNGRAAQT